MTTKDFDAALKLVLRYEGGYGNDPDDPGGETYKGISRRNHGAWAGWPRIDAHKGHGDFSKRLEGDARLQTLVADVYKDSYWLRNLCDQLPAGIDLVVFDTAVNMGSGKAGRFLQQGVNKLLAGPVLKVDGVIGVLTLAAVNGLDRERQEQLCSLFLREFLPSAGTGGN